MCGVGAGVAVATFRYPVASLQANLKEGAKAFRSFKMQVHYDNPDELARLSANCSDALACGFNHTSPLERVSGLRFRPHNTQAPPEQCFQIVLSKTDSVTKTNNASFRHKLISHNVVIVVCSVLGWTTCFVQTGHWDNSGLNILLLENPREHEASASL